MKKHILALVLTVVCISLYAVNPIKEGNMISGHVIVKGIEENIPYATILIKKTAREQSQMKKASSNFASFLPENIRFVYQP